MEGGQVHPRLLPAGLSWEVAFCPPWTEISAISSLGHQALFSSQSHSASCPGLSPEKPGGGLDLGKKCPADRISVALAVAVQM